MSEQVIEIIHRGPDGEIKSIEVSELPEEE
jgi:hypothetical protein